MNGYILNQFFTTQLNVGGGITNSQTTGIVIQSVAGLDITKPGIALLTYADPLDTAVAEWITYTSINGSNELQGVTRGQEGFSAKSHSNEAVVAFPLSESHVNNLTAALAIGGVYTNLVTTTLDEDTMSSNSATALATQQSIKAYVDVSTGKAVNTVASSATPSINTDTTGMFTITALATAITSMTTNLTGTPVEGQKLIIRIKDDGTARAITWGASFVSRGATLPTTTILGKYHYVGFIYNGTASKWDCVAAIVET